MWAVASVAIPEKSRKRLYKTVKKQVCNSAAVWRVFHTISFFAFQPNFSQKIWLKFPSSHLWPPIEDQ
jgi:hypothetical protein